MRLKALTKSALCQALKKPARQGSKAANKGAYTDVSDRNLQPKLTQQAKTSSIFLSFDEIFALAGFVSGLSRIPHTASQLITGNSFPHRMEVNPNDG